MRSLWGMEDEDGGGWLVAGGGKRSWKRRKGKTGSGRPGNAHKRTKKTSGVEQIVWDPTVLDEEVDERTAAALNARTREAQKVLRESAFHDQLCSSALGRGEAGEGPSLLSGLGSVEEMVVYGLGSLEHGPPACKYQFALAVVLAEDLLRSDKLERVLFFDPAFTAYDRRVIEGANPKFCVMRENENCARTAFRKTLFYMPHCEAVLYNALLGANWDLERLPNLVILGNSFASYKTIWGRPSGSDFGVEYPKLFSAARCSREVPVPTSFNLTEASAFNDMSFHFFPREAVADALDEMT